MEEWGEWNSLVRLYPVLAEVAPEEIARALRRSKVLRLEAGTQVFEELQGCHAFPFVLTGELRVVKRSESGREISLYAVLPGDACVVSAACLLGNKPYNAVGIVQAACDLVMMPAEEFNQLLGVRAFREFFFSLFSRRVVDLMLLIDEVAFRRLDQRLARLLISKGPSVEASHQHLANELGTVREMVTRTLNDFSQRRWVRLNRGSIQIIDRQGLEKACVT